MGSAKKAPAPEPPPPPQLAPVDFKRLPWRSGEALTFLITMSSFKAAQGTFTATEKGSGWEFKLELASQGLVQEFYPFTGSFWCILAKGPWRSLEYGEYRFEPGLTIQERTRINYGARQATREFWSEGKTKVFPISQPAIDDVGTMLYHMRAVPWKIGEKRTVFVYEHNSEKQGVVVCEARESRAFGIWPKQPLLRIAALPGKGTHRGGKLVFWITDDVRRLPVHADLDFYYGSFSIDLVKATGTIPTGY